MARKIKFALEMANHTKVRTLEDLREFFDLKQAIGYFFDGKLLEWLEDRYYTKEAEEIRQLDKDAEDFQQRLCIILGVSYREQKDIEAGTVGKLHIKSARLRQLTSDESILSKAGSFAFTQEELESLWEEGTSPIYLCGEEFTISAAFPHCHYIGILQKPTVLLDLSSIPSLPSRDITFENVCFGTQEWNDREICSYIMQNVIAKAAASFPAERKHLLAGDAAM